MRYRLKVQKRALREIGQAKAYYKAIKPELGEKFQQQVKEAFAFAKTLPYGSDLVSSLLRRLNVSDFPYALLYAVELRDGKLSEIVIVACIHQHSDPDTWPEAPE